MIIPGANLLALASRAIGSQSVTHRAWVSRATNAAGIDVDVYASPAPIMGSMQSINRATYQTLGLDLQKNYANLYTSANVRDVRRDRTGDLIDWNGATWRCESGTDWSAQDGWRQVLCVEVPGS